MARTGTTKPGETLEQFSTRVTGSSANARAIRRANPGIADVVPENTTLIVPNTSSFRSLSIPAILGVGGDDVTVTVDGDEFTHWMSVSISRSIDRLPTITVSAPFDPDSSGVRQMFRPFSFRDMGVYVGGQPFFTGTMLTPQPSSDGTSTRIEVDGYGTTGVLNDCTMPASAFPLEYNGQTLDVIARDLIEPFGINVVFDAPVGAPFEKVSLSETQKVMDFLAKLAKQRNMVIGETALGELLFTQSTNTGAPVAAFGPGALPTESISAQFDAQQYFSHMTGVSPTTSQARGAQITQQNPHATGLLRPSTFQPGDTENQNTTEAVDARLARMFANMVKYSVSVPTWRNANGSVWQPNTTVRVVAPRAMIYRETELLIRSVTLNASGDTRTARLELVLAGAFAGEVPDVLPWSN